MEQPVKKIDYTFFNRFQTMFYTNIDEFQKFTYFEIKNNSFVLLTNLIKGFPSLAEEMLNIYSPAIKIFESPAIIIALQRKFVNNFSRPRTPQFLYYKSAKAKPASKAKQKEIKKDGVVLKIFSDDIVNEIKSILMYDSKTYDYLKFSDKVQFLGNQLVGEFKKQEEEKIKKSRKS
jgi:hypothetical protein